MQQEIINKLRINLSSCTTAYAPGLRNIAQPKVIEQLEKQTILTKEAMMPDKKEIQSDDENHNLQHP